MPFVFIAQSFQCLCGNHCTFAKPATTLPPLQIQMPSPARTAVQPLPSPIPPQLATSTARSKCANLCARAPHRACSNQMCKQCCVIRKGGCQLQGHKPERLSARQREKLQVNQLVSPANTSGSLPPLDSSVIEALQGLYRSNPTSAFVNQDLEQLDLEAQEEVNYQRAIASSLDLPFITPLVIPRPSTSTKLETPPHSPSARAIASSLDLPFITPLVIPRPSMFTELETPPHSPSAQNPVHTVPYKSSGITQHMNEDWMRPVEDKTKKPRRPNLKSNDNCFTIIFWDEVRVLHSVSSECEYL